MFRPRCALPLALQVLPELRARLDRRLDERNLSVVDRNPWHHDCRPGQLVEKVNNGRHPEFIVPKRIEIVVPTTMLGDDTVSVTLIDTPRHR